MRIAAAFVLGALVVVSRASLSQAAPPPARAEFHHSYPLSATGAFTLDDARGSIRVIGWDKHSVQVDARECAPSADDLKNLTISVDSKPGSVSIKTLFPQENDDWFAWVRLLGWSTWCNEHPEVYYTVHVPLRARVALTTASADMEVTGPIGALSTETSSGDLSVTDVSDVTGESQSGDMTIARARGTFSLTTTSGDVLFDDAAGDINVESTSGVVRLYRVSGKAVVTTTSGDITARAFGGIARLSSTSGDVSVTLVRGKGVSVSVNSISGDIQSEVPMSTRAAVELRTISGDISVRSL